MFEKLEIWERGEDMTTIYVVFRNLETGLYHVQQANFLYHDASRESIRETRASHHDYVVDLFKGQSPDELASGFATAKEAVEWHKADFADMSPR